MVDIDDDDIACPICGAITTEGYPKPESAYCGWRDAVRTDQVADDGDWYPDDD
jgi:hypothetical protein